MTRWLMDILKDHHSHHPSSQPRDLPLVAKASNQVRTYQAHHLWFHSGHHFRSLWRDCAMESVWDFAVRLSSFHVHHRCFSSLHLDPSAQHLAWCHLRMLLQRDRVRIGLLSSAEQHEGRGHGHLPLYDCSFQRFGRDSKPCDWYVWSLFLLIPFLFSLLSSLLFSLLFSPKSLSLSIYIY